MPEWWNGRHGCLKSICLKGHAGSSPASGTHSENVGSRHEHEVVYPQSTVELAKLLSDLGALDRENAAICGVSVGAIRHWRAGNRRGSAPPPAAWPVLTPRACQSTGRACFRSTGLGGSNERRIELEPWQQEIVTAYPGDFARGLFHSDGCRLINRVRRPLKDGDRWYEYPRYLFVNKSADVHRLCGEALDRLGVAWRFSKPTTISVARREAVARLNEFVGPKC